jgi:DNA-binding CsgD family transcriptional regulator
MDHEAANGYYNESLEMALELDNKGLLASCMEGFAAMLTSRAIQRGNKGAENKSGQFMVDSDAFVDLRWAVQCWGGAEALRDAAGLPIVPIDHDQYKRLSGIAREQLGEATFSKEWGRGRVASPRQVIHAPDLAGPTIPASVVAPAKSASISLPDGLTARELEVLQLIAQGLTSAQMAERLILSPLTVNSHVRSIYNKLGVTSRSGATSYAIKQGLV